MAQIVTALTRIDLQGGWIFVEGDTGTRLATPNRKRRKAEIAAVQGLTVKLKAKERKAMQLIGSTAKPISGWAVPIIILAEPHPAAGSPDPAPEPACVRIRSENCSAERLGPDS